MTTKRRNRMTFLCCALLGLAIISGPARAQEPAMANYTCFPIFQISSVEPNILIMLDNSGSMNYNAYGPYPGDGGLVNDSFLGEPYTFVESRIIRSADDMEEPVDGAVYGNNPDLDLGRDISGGNFEDMKIGMRFEGIKVPAGATITRAYIEFTEAAGDYDGVPDPDPSTKTVEPDLELNIEGMASEPEFEETPYNLSDRERTAALVSWLVPDWSIDGAKHQTPDLSAIVQQMVNRPGWEPGGSMAFIITNPGGPPASGRRAVSYDGATVPEEAPRLHIEFSREFASRYYGYFSPDHFYYHSSNVFYLKYKKIEYVGDPAAGGSWSARDLDGNPVTLTDADIVAEGLWDGNWLNWATMRRIDVLRKVLMGGLATARTGGGNQQNYGETPQQAERTFIRHFDTTGWSAVCPYDGDFYYEIADGYIYVDDDADPVADYTNRLPIIVQKDVEHEPQDFYDYDSGDNLAGVLQRVGPLARWGNEWFNDGTGNLESGGFISSPIGTNTVSMVTDLQNTGADTWTPLAEAFYVATQYFKQQPVAAGLDYPNNVIPCDNVGQDPFYNGDEFVWCAGAFVLLLTDGASTMDSMVPAEFKDYDGDGTDNTACDESTGDNCDYADSGTDYLDDLALYARTTDLRSATVGKTELHGDQNILLYTVYAFGDDDNARSLLMNASRNGGFVDRNGNKQPDGDWTDPPENRLEWDEDGDGVPDTYFEASDGYELQRQLLNAITAILERAGSGTAVSVLATSGEGEGNLVQAYFRPQVTSGLQQIKWLGYLQSLWVDPLGNLREDTNGNVALDVTVDKVVRYFLDSESTGDTKIKRFNVTEDAPYPDVASDPYEVVDVEDIAPLWEAGSRLAERSADDRRLFTFIDKNADDAVDDGFGSQDPFDNTGELVSLHWDAAAEIKPYLGVKDDLTWGHLGATHDERVENIIRFMRGEEVPGLRTRELEGQIWKLGDIVHSTPSSISAPPSGFHLIYGDESYYNYQRSYLNSVLSLVPVGDEYKARMRNRETVVYVGGNDGMLHAFGAWNYNRDTREYEKPPAASATERIGDELWAYVPQNILPHLKWLADPDYTHVYYVDAEPRVFDADILPDDTHASDADSADDWGTILLVGFNLGGGPIWAEGDFDYNAATPDTVRNFRPAYVCMDVTDPRNPRLLWERSYDGLGLTTSVPAPIRVNGEWFAVFGSGPTDCQGSGTMNGHVFVVDLKTGEPYQPPTGTDWLFETAEAQAFMNSATSLDKALNFSVDSVYIGESYQLPSKAWVGKIYRIGIPCLDAAGEYDEKHAANYVTDPLDPTHPWTFSSFYQANGPVTAPLSLSLDTLDNVWVYGGTGRYYSELDKTGAIAEATQHLFGIKDPFYNRQHTPVPAVEDGIFHVGDDFYHNYSLFLELSQSDLLLADGYEIGYVDGVENQEWYLDPITGEVRIRVFPDTTKGALGRITTWEGTTLGGNYGLLDVIRNTPEEQVVNPDYFEGWVRTLETPKERLLTKPAIIGGTVFASTFVPNDDVCGFGGESYLYGLYYETGTAYPKPVFVGGTSTVTVGGGTAEVVVPSIYLGSGKPSSPTIHAGAGQADGGEEGEVTILTQQSTIEVVQTKANPALKFRSGLTAWKER